MAVDVINNDLTVNGTLTPRVLSAPAGFLTNAMVQASAGVSASKLQQQRNIQYAQASGSDVAAETRPVFRCNGATGVVAAVKASIVTIPSGDKSCTIDVKKNGTTILSGTFTLDSGNTTYVAEAGSISSSALVAGDVLEVVVTIAGSTGTAPRGLLVNIVLTEDPA